MVTATKSFGSKLYRETSPGSGTFTLVSGMRDMNFPELQADTAETTTQETPGAHRTHIATLFALGDVSGEMLYDSTDAAQAQLTADASVGTMRLYKIIATDAGQADWAFDAIITRFAPSFSRDGLSVAGLTLKPSGQVTRT